MNTYFVQALSCFFVLSKLLQCTIEEIALYDQKGIYMMSKKITLLATLFLSLFFLTACMSDFQSYFKPEETSSRASSKKQEKSEKEASSSKKSSKTSSSNKEKKESKTETSSSKKWRISLPMLAKLQQTRSMQQAILSFTIEKMAIHQKPQHRITKAILKNLFKKFLGNLKNVLNDPKYLVETFSEKERENLVKLYQEGHLTDEQLRAFWAGAIDIAQATRFGQTYTVYIYKQGQVQLVFKEDNLIYITPNPEVLYFN